MGDLREDMLRVCLIILTGLFFIFGYTMVIPSKAVSNSVNETYKNRETKCNTYVTEGLKIEKILEYRREGDSAYIAAAKATRHYNTLGLEYATGEFEQIYAVYSEYTDRLPLNKDVKKTTPLAQRIFNMPKNATLIEAQDILYKECMEGAAIPPKRRARIQTITYVGGKNDCFIDLIIFVKRAYNRNNSVDYKDVILRPGRSKIYSKTGLITELRCDENVMTIKKYYQN